jgi:predicted nucleic acid-binding protein
MGKMKIPKNSKVMLDTSPIIYYIEDIEPYASLLNSLFANITRGDNVAVTSVVTLIEVLTKPIRDKNKELEEKFRLYFTNSKNIEMISVTPDIGEKASLFRAKYNLKTPDAIQTAVAIYSESSFLITNDRIFKKITEMKVIILDDLL